AEFLEQSERRVDHAGAGAVGAADLVLDRLDDLVAMPRLLGDQIENDQPQIAMGEEPAKPAPASPAMPVAAELPAFPLAADKAPVIAVLAAAAPVLMVV